MRLLLPLLRRNFPDIPNQRSSHVATKPRGGGILFVVLGVISSTIFQLTVKWHVDASTRVATLPLVCLTLAVVGLLDDRYDLRAEVRFGVQLATAATLVLISPLDLYGIYLLPILVVSATSIINFTNFMDGLDGLVSGCMTIALSTAAIELKAPWPTWCLIGSLLGFLVFNWHPAKVFMGDVGSTFLGAMFAGLVLQAPNWSMALGILLIATPLLCDAGVCVIHRLILGQNILQAHRLHLYQRLNQAGWSAARISSIYIAATAVLALAQLIGGIVLVSVAAFAVVALGILIDRRYAACFADP
jgi:UDP-N-acetylmuramyl pentapeptide phosphotransferase/UDP-N-acetylglucosamine-1-phosphate transferase